MEVVAPLGVEPVSVGVAGADQARVVEVAFGDDDGAAAGVGFEGIDLGAELLHEIDCGAIHVGMDGVEAESVEVVIAEPHDGVVAKEAADFERAGVFEVHGVAPRGVVRAG
jgi:hypothetical protein